MQRLIAGITAAFFACVGLCADVPTHDDLVEMLAKVIPPGTVTDEHVVRADIFDVKTMKYRELSKDLQLTDAEHTLARVSVRHAPQLEIGIDRGSGTIGVEIVDARTQENLLSVGKRDSCFASDAAAAALPKDPCALLKPAEIQTLAPNAKIGSGVVDTSMAPLGVGCTYTCGPKTPQWGESALTITVMDTSQSYPGVSPDLIQQGLLAQVKAQAYLKAKGVRLSVKFHAGDSLSNKDKLIALLKGAAARL